MSLSTQTHNTTDRHWCSWSLGLWLTLMATSCWGWVPCRHTRKYQNWKYFLQFILLVMPANSNAWKSLF